jgi:genome maintenance exonuclease 1
MKTFIHHDFPEIERKTSETGSRVYVTPQGNVYPSVTTVTGLHSNEGIQQWRNRVGELEADRVTKIASDRGNAIHNYCEKFLLDQPIVFDNMFYESTFKTIIPWLDEIDNIRALETPLYCDFLKVAGTVDCIADFKGKLSIIDFKTATKIKERDDIHAYFMQTAAYAVAFEERTGIPISRLVIIMAIEHDYPRLFIEKRDNWIAGFRKLRLDYKNKFDF